MLPSPVDSPAHRGDFVVDVLERLRVGQVEVRSSGIESLAEATPFDEVLRRVANSSETLFPVVDRDGRLLVFAFMSNGSGDATSARTALDLLAGRVAVCGCR